MRPCETDACQTIDWHVMQDPKDPSKFCIVERYEQESSQQYHLNNPVSSKLVGSAGRGPCNGQVLEADAEQY